MGALGAFAALAGCRAPTEITLDLTSDIPCDQLLGTSITVGPFDAIEGLPPATTTTQCSSDGHIGTIVVIPSGSDSADVAVRIVGGQRVDPEKCAAPSYAPAPPLTGGCVVARRLLSFEPHDPLFLPILLRSDCVGVPCRPTETCVNGSCVNATIADPKACSTPGACSEASLGDAGAPEDAGGGDAGGDGGVPSTTGAHTVAAGDDFSCALGSDARVYCWGANVTMVADTHDPVLAPSPAAVPPSTAISASDHVCAIAKGTKALYCWDGYGYFTGDGMQVPTPTPVTAAAAVDEVVAPPRTTCFRSGGTVSCFGEQSFGNLGTGSVVSGMKVVTVVAGIHDATALSTGSNAVCALRPAPSGGTRATCWSQDVLTPADIPGEQAVAQVTHFPGWAIVRRTDGSVVASQAMGGTWLPTVPLSLPPVDAIVGGVLLCAIRSSDKAVICASGVTPGLPAVDVSVVSGFPASDPVVELSSWVSHSVYLADVECARTRAGKVYCWGFDEIGQIGVGLPDAELTPKPVASMLTTAVRLSTTEVGTAAVLSDGTVVEWGASAAFGHDVIGQQLSLVPTPIPGSFTKVSRLSAAGADTAAYVVHTDGTLGYLDHGGPTTMYALEAFPNAPQFFAIQRYTYLDAAAAGTPGTLGTFLAFFMPDPTDPMLVSSFELPNGGMSPAGAYVSIPLSGLVGLSGGFFHGLAWDVSGTLFCWGGNDSPRCGQDPTTTTSVVTPTPITLAGEQVIDACGGWDSTCAVTQSGKLYGWGLNTYGLGGVVGAEHMPAEKAPGNAFKGVACSEFDACAWSDTAVYCWGANGLGQVGSGDRVDKMTPTLVAGLPGAKHVSLSNEHGCAVTMTGGVSCWGNGFGGKLGNGKTGYYASAQLVAKLP